MTLPLATVEALKSIGVHTQFFNFSSSKEYIKTPITLPTDYPIRIIDVSDDTVIQFFPNNHGTDTIIPLIPNGACWLLGICRSNDNGCNPYNGYVVPHGYLCKNINFSSPWETDLYRLFYVSIVLQHNDQIILPPVIKQETYITFTLDLDNGMNFTLTGNLKVKSSNAGISGKTVHIGMITTDNKWIVIDDCHTISGGLFVDIFPWVHGYETCVVYFEGDDNYESSSKSFDLEDD